MGIIFYFYNVFNQSEMKKKYIFRKDNPSNKVYWVEDSHYIGEMKISFDKKRIYNLFTDYPNELTRDEKVIFDKEYPYWANFFSSNE